MQYEVEFSQPRERDEDLEEAKTTMSPTAVVTDLIDAEDNEDGLEKVDF